MNKNLIIKNNLFFIILVILVIFSMINGSTLEFLKNLEEYLINICVKIEIVKKIMTAISVNVIKNDINNIDTIISLLQSHLSMIMKKHTLSFDVDVSNKPYVMLVCGINGSGKTTMIGRMIKLLQSYGWDILVAGCDNYRAAAERQLVDWIENPKDNFISFKNENDTPSKIAIQAYNEAKNKNKDILMIDTSGRLQNNQNLMLELLKIKQKLHKLCIKAPHDTVLIIDSNCGYNALEQAKMYNDLIGIKGIMVTKLDISKTPGIILTICETLNIGVFGISDGEMEDQIRDFDADEFAKILLQDIKKIM